MISTLSREQWLDLRKKSIGASEAAAACGENPHESAISLWMYKTGRDTPPDLSDLERIYWGNVHEPAVVRATCDRLGLRLLGTDEAVDVLGQSPDVEVLGLVEGRQLFLRSKAHPWMTATLDGIAQDPADGSFGDIEAKTTDKRNASDWDDERSPEYYRIQVAHQLIVAPPLAWGVLSCLVGGNDLRITPRMDRATAPLEALTKLERAFWDHVEQNAPPEVDGSESSARALKILHPDDNGESVVLPEKFVFLCKRERELAALLSEYGDERDTLATLIKAAIGANTYGVLPNGLGTYSLKTSERKGYVVEPGKSRRLLFSQPKTTKPKSATRNK